MQSYLQDDLFPGLLQPIEKQQEQEEEAGSRAYILRAIAEFERSSPSCRCGLPVIISAPGAGPHWRKLICAGCGNFFKWLPKPKGGREQ